MKFIICSSATCLSALLVLSSSLNDSVSVLVEGHGYKYKIHRNNQKKKNKNNKNLRSDATAANQVAAGTAPNQLRGNKKKISQASAAEDERFLKELTIIRSTKPAITASSSTAGGRVLVKESVGGDGKIKKYDPNNDPSGGGRSNSDVHLDGIRFTSDGRVEHVSSPTDGSRTDVTQIEAKYAAKAAANSNNENAVIGPKSVNGVSVTSGGGQHKPWVPPLLTDEDTVEEHSTRIVGGSQSSVGEFPYFVDLRPANVGCGATLIAPRVVLTAAHCDSNYRNDWVHISAYNRDSSSNGAIRKQVQAQKTHPDFDDPVNLANDFQLLLLKEPAYITDGPKAHISLDGGIYQPEEDTTLRVIGLGRTSSGGSSPSKLRDVNVPVVNINTCRNKYGGSKVQRDIMFCAGDINNGGEDSCQGDSGGPIVIEHDDYHELVGVVSWGISCADRRYPGVYAKVGAVNDWIKDVVCDEWNLNNDEDAGTICGAVTIGDTPSPTPSPNPPPPTPSPTPVPTEGPLDCTTNTNGKTLALDFLVTTDDWGYETSYEIKDRDTSTVLAQAGEAGEFMDFTTYRFNECIDPTQCTQITVLDTRNDGFCCNAGCGTEFCGGNPSIELLLDGQREVYLHTASEVDFGSSWSYQVGDCTTVGNPDPTPAPTPFPTIIDTACDPDKIGVEWRLGTDNYASETKWTLRNRHGPPIDVGTNLQDWTTYEATFCLARSGCYIMRLDDTMNDGLSGSLGGNNPYFYEMKLAGQVVVSEQYGTDNINFGPFMEIEFGDCDVQCGGDQMLVDWEFRTDGFGSETSWQLVDRQNLNVLLGGAVGTYEDDNVYRFQNCVPRNGCYQIQLMDDYGDGFCCNGDPHYKLIVDGTVIVDVQGNEEFGAERDIDFGVCNAGADPSPTPSPTVAQPGPTPSPSVAQPGPTPSPTVAQPGPTPSPTVAQPGPTPSPTVAQPAPTPSPTEGSAQSSGCNGNERMIFFQFQTDGYGEETSWELRDDSGSQLEHGGEDGSYLNAETYTFTRCVPDNGCYDLTIRDSYHDGQCCGGDGTPFYLIKYGTAEIAFKENDNFGAEVSYRFGTNCPEENEGSNGSTDVEPAAAWQTVFFEDFEGGWGVFYEPSDGRASISGSKAYPDGNGQSLKIRGDNPNRSIAASGPYDVSGKNLARLTFFYFAHEDVDGEDHFDLLYSGDGSSFTRVERYDFGSNGFDDNEVWYPSTVEWDISSLNSLYVQFRTDLDEGKIFFDNVKLETK